MKQARSSRIPVHRHGIFQVTVIAWVRRLSQKHSQGELMEEISDSFLSDDAIMAHDCKSRKLRDPRPPASI